VKYLLMLCGDGTGGAMAGCDDWTAEMGERRVLHASLGLRPDADATTVRLRADEVQLAAGPADQIAGLYVVDCSDLDEAIEVASRHPWARSGRIEVRPVWP
jgi:hypothetical protein